MDPSNSPGASGRAAPARVQAGWGRSPLVALQYGQGWSNKQGQQRMMQVAAPLQLQGYASHAATTRIRAEAHNSTAQPLAARATRQRGWHEQKHHALCLCRSLTRQRLHRA